jgi:hypothetical protein
LQIKLLKKTPHLFSAHILKGEIDIKRNKISAIADIVKKSQSIIDNPKNFDRKSGLRRLLQLQFELAIENREFAKAIKILSNSASFYDDEKSEAVKRVDFIKARMAQGRRPNTP